MLSRCKHLHKWFQYYPCLKGDILFFSRILDLRRSRFVNIPYTPLTLPLWCQYNFKIRMSTMTGDVTLPHPATILLVLSLQIKANQVPLKPVIKMGPSWPQRPLYLAQTYLSFLPATSLPSELFGLRELFHDFVLMGTLWPLPGIYLYFIISMITKTITTTTATSTLLPSSFSSQPPSPTTTSFQNQRHHHHYHCPFTTITIQ